MEYKARKYAVCVKNGHVTWYPRLFVLSGGWQHQVSWFYLSTLLIDEYIQFLSILLSSLSKHAVPYTRVFPRFFTLFHSHNKDLEVGYPPSFRMLPFILSLAQVSFNVSQSGFP